MAKSCTMQDIATELKISKSIVSRALSDQYGVSDETKNKIKVTALKMGYQFSGKVKDKFDKTESVTIVVERHDLIDSGFWVKVINGIEKELNKRNISVFLSVIENDDENFMPMSIKQMKTRGVLILGIMPLKHIISFATTGLPIVLIDSLYSNLKFDHVMANNYFGGYEVTELLIRNGHTKIGFVGAMSYSYSFRERFRGFSDCLTEQKNANVKQFSIIDDFKNYDIPFSIEQFKKIMMLEHRPTALVCANDPAAFIVYEILKEMGFDIPSDISVVGFDNVEKSEWVSPQLTTVNIPKTDLGQIAVELLLKRIENPGKSIELVMVGTAIVKRDSIFDLDK